MRAIHHHLLGSGVLGAIPSPSSNSIGIGPLQLRAYGLMIALGVVAAVWLSQRRWRDRGGDPADITAIAMWAVPAGLIGARLYHVITDHQRFEGRWWEVVEIWQGGLGIPGGLAAGVATGVWVAHRRRLPVPVLLDVVAPAVPLAQAIGRLGNWFNQELFGGPTDLPWAVGIDVAHRPAGLEQFATYQPTFLYEALWNLGLVALLLVIERRWHLRAGSLFLCYVVGYAAGRMWVEALRIDPASEILGLRVNFLLSLVVLVGAVGILVWRETHRPAVVGPPDGDVVDSDAIEGDAIDSDVTDGDAIDDDQGRPPR